MISINLKSFLIRRCQQIQKGRILPKESVCHPKTKFVQAKKKRELEQESVSCVNSVTDSSIEPEISSDQPSFKSKESKIQETCSLFFSLTLAKVRVFTLT